MTAKHKLARSFDEQCAKRVSLGKIKLRCQRIIGHEGEHMFVYFLPKRLRPRRGEGKKEG